MREQVGEVGCVASRGKYGVEHDLSAGAMVGVIESVKREKILRVAGDEDIRFVAADLADKVSAEVKVWDQIPVREVQKKRRLGSNDFGGFGLFPVSNPAKFFGSHIRLGGGVEALVAAGEQ